MRTALALQRATFSRSLTARLGSVLIVTLPPLFSLGMVAVARSSRSTGPSAAKLAPFREGTYGEAVATLAGQVVPVTVLITVGFAIAWLVGREWADHTIGSLFSLPTTRAAIARAKVVVVLAWAVVGSTFAMCLVTLGIVAFGGGTLNVEVATSLVRVWLTALIMCGLAMPFGWVAVRMRGFLGAVGAIIAVTAASQILASLGVGSWVPYVAPALWAGAAGPTVASTVGTPALAIAVAFGALGAWLLVRAFATARLD